MPPSSAASVSDALAHELQVLGVDEDRHALALDQPAQRAAHDVDDDLGPRGDRARRSPARRSAAPARRPARSTAAAMRARSAATASAAACSAATPDGHLRLGLDRARPGSRPRGRPRGRPRPRPRGRSAGPRAPARRWSAKPAVGLQRGEGEVLHQMMSSSEDSPSSPPRPIVIAPASSRRRMAPTMRALRLLDDRPPLRLAGVQVLLEHLGAARGHVAEDGVLDLVVDAAQRQPEVLLVDLAQQQLDVAVVQDDDVVEGEELLADLVGQLAVGLGDRLEHRALGRAAGAVEQLGERVDAAGLARTPASGRWRA